MSIEGQMQTGLYQFSRLQQADIGQLQTTGVFTNLCF